MIDRRFRPGVAGAVRLAAATPLYLVGLATMATSVAARGLLVGAVAGVLLAGVAAASVPGPLPAVGYLAVAAVVGSLAFLGWVGRARRILRTRARLYPAVLLLGTRSAATDAERRVGGILDRLARQVDLPAPALRIVRTDRPVSFTVGYPADAPPAKLIERTLEGRFRRRRPGEGRDPRTGPTPSAFADSVDAEYVVVVSSGLLETLSRAQLTAVLAHELAHVRNGDLSLMNWLLVPVLWAESALESVLASGSSGRSPAAALRSGAKLLALGITLPGVAVFARGREFAADRGAAEITGDPAALAGALETLSDDAGSAPVRDLRAAATLNVVAPASGGIPLSHPATERRIRRLRAMTADQAA